jgi:hypothetical protein
MFLLKSTLAARRGFLVFALSAAVWPLIMRNRTGYIPVCATRRPDWTACTRAA